MTADAAALEPSRIGLAGWGMLAFRLTLIIGLLIVCVPFHLLWRLFRLPRFWPRIFLSGVGALSGLHIKRIGRATRGSLLISNHVSWLDIPALAEASGSAFVAHDGLSEFSLLKWLCEMNDTVFVARNRRTNVAEQAEDIRTAIDNGGTLTLFPEGTTSDGTELLPFKSALLSAFEPLPEGVSVQPVLLAYHDAPQISWVGDEPGLDNFKRVLARFRPIKLDIHFLEPLSGEALTDRKSMAAASHASIQRAMTL